MSSLECPICLGLYKDPKLILCGHSFCKECLLQLPSNTPLHCPLCKHPYASVDGLPSNFVLLQWLEDSKALPNPSLCANCEERGAVVWCEYCTPGTPYCTECDGEVHSLKALKSHPRVGLKEHKKKAQYQNCTSHEEGKKFLCLDCNELQCSVCVAENHVSHEVITIFKYAETLRRGLKEEVSVFGEVMKEDMEKEILMEREIDMLVAEVNRIQLVLKERNVEKVKLNEERVRNEVCYRMLGRVIEEMNVNELMDKEKKELIRSRIHNLYQNLPSQVYMRVQEEIIKREKEEMEKWERWKNGRLEKEKARKIREGKEREEKVKKMREEKERDDKIEKERVEKERMEKLRMERERLEKERLRLRLPITKVGFHSQGLVLSSSTLRKPFHKFGCAYGNIPRDGHTYTLRFSFETIPPDGRVNVYVGTTCQASAPCNVLYGSEMECFMIEKAEVNQIEMFLVNTKKRNVVWQRDESKALPFKGDFLCIDLPRDNIKILRSRKIKKSH